jgi:hypothetical protein
VSLNEIKKEFQIAGKGHNLIFVITIPVKHMRAATNSVDGHVSENGGTCQFTKLCRSEGEGVIALQLMQKEGKSIRIGNDFASCLWFGRKLKRRYHFAIRCNFHVFSRLLW